MHEWLPTRRCPTALQLCAVGLLLMAVLPEAAWAERPRMVVAGSAGGTAYGYDEGESDRYARTGAEFRVSRRRALAGGGYVGLSGLFAVDYFTDPVDDAEDTEYLSAELALPLAGNRLEVDAESVSSLHYAGDLDAYAEPSWALRYRITRGRREAEPYLGYRGSYRYQAGGDEDRLDSRAVLGVEYDPSVRLGTRLELTGGYEWWPDAELVRADGSEANEVRGDIVADATISLDGLIGYFVDWELSVRGRYRDSTANRYLTAANEREEDSEDRLGIDTDVGLRWTPTRRIGIDGGAGLSFDAYTARSVLDKEGLPTGDDLRVTTLDGRLSADWTPNDTLFIVVGTNVERDLSNDDYLEGWSVGGDVAVEYVLP